MNNKFGYDDDIKNNNTTTTIYDNYDTASAYSKFNKILIIFLTYH